MKDTGCARDMKFECVVVFVFLGLCLCVFDCVVFLVCV